MTVALCFIKFHFNSVGGVVCTYTSKQEGLFYHFWSFCIFRRRSSFHSTQICQRNTPWWPLEEVPLPMNIWMVSVQLKCCKGTCRKRKSCPPQISLGTLCNLTSGIRLLLLQRYLPNRPPPASLWSQGAVCWSSRAGSLAQCRMFWSRGLWTSCLPELGKFFFSSPCRLLCSTESFEPFWPKHWVEELKAWGRDFWTRSSWPPNGVSPNK